MDTPASEAKDDVDQQGQRKRRGGRPSRGVASRRKSKFNTHVRYKSAQYVPQARGARATGRKSQAALSALPPHALATGYLPAPQPLTAAQEAYMDMMQASDPRLLGLTLNPRANLDGADTSRLREQILNNQLSDSTIQSKERTSKLILSSSSTKRWNVVARLPTLQVQQWFDRQVNRQCENARSQAH
jgi:hypothetical protein